MPARPRLPLPPDAIAGLARWSITKRPSGTEVTARRAAPRWRGRISRSKTKPPLRHRPETRRGPRAEAASRDPARPARGCGSRPATRPDGRDRRRSSCSPTSGACRSTKPTTPRIRGVAAARSSSSSVSATSGTVCTTTVASKPEPDASATRSSTAEGASDGRHGVGGEPRLGAHGEVPHVVVAVDPERHEPAGAHAGPSGNRNCSIDASWSRAPAPGAVGAR